MPISITGQTLNADGGAQPGGKDKEMAAAVKHVAGSFWTMTTVPFNTTTSYGNANGNAVIATDKVDLVAFGAPYIANPDLVEQLRADTALNTPNPSLFYGEGAEGYTDYAFIVGTAAA
jgi:2,4-dienoyl-CoA reductase-like NADH-dependent reductase (Old Yellow Enzyme family)